VNRRPPKNKRRIGFGRRHLKRKAPLLTPAGLSFRRRKPLQVQRYGRAAGVRYLDALKL
jgi:hypothetical protein